MLPHEGRVLARILGHVLNTTPGCLDLRGILYKPARHCSHAVGSMLLLQIGMWDLAYELPFATCEKSTKGPVL